MRDGDVVHDPRDAQGFIGNGFRRFALQSRTHKSIHIYHVIYRLHVDRMRGSQFPTPIRLRLHIR
jgi:hypothetical protein